GDPGLRDLWLRVLSTPQGRLLLKGNTADAQDENDLDRCLGMTMLVLSRRAGQSLQIGNAIEVELSEVSAQHAHFSVTVDEDVAVILPELYDSSMIEPMPRTTEVLLADGGRRRRLVRVSRARDQQIMIGADVEIRVIAIFSDRVHLNVDAPTQFVMIRNR
ncbi:MAG TPA: carbon storage regulator, partial [Steroidobacteraceae bacterium]|nr:carbon storage regulator [Steroidobacteraceae bacterium]